MEEAGVEAGVAGFIGIFRPSEEHQASVVPNSDLSHSFGGRGLRSGAASMCERNGDGGPLGVEYPARAEQVWRCVCRPAG